MAKPGNQKTRFQTKTQDEFYAWPKKDRNNYNSNFQNDRLKKMYYPVILNPERLSFRNKSFVHFHYGTTFRTGSQCFGTVKVLKMAQKILFYIVKRKVN